MKLSQPAAHPRNLPAAPHWRCNPGAFRQFWFWLAGLFIVWLASAGSGRLRSAMLAKGILAMAALVMGIKLLVRRKRPSGEWGMLYRSTVRTRFHPVMPPGLHCWR